MSSLNVKRVSKRLSELYLQFIDLKDVKGKDKDNHFNTRALAGVALNMKCGLSEEQAAFHITDGYHDLGIDAIYLDETQKTLFLVQSKWRNDGYGSIDREEMDTFVGGIKRLIDFDTQGANKKIIAKKPEIEKALTGIEYKIEAVFIHTGNDKIDGYIMRPMNELLAMTNDDAGDILHFSQISFKDVYRFLADSGFAEDIAINDVVLTNWGKIEKPYLSYYGVVSAMAVGEWYNTYGNKLFAQNIRFYKGRTDVNDGIRKVLISEPDNFVYYNNGMKLLCKKIIRKAKNSTTKETGIFNLEGVSLINGAQTAGSIGAIYMEEPSKLEKAYVIIQMIDMSNMDDGVSKQITKLSNTQNRIENKDFASQDPVQEKIKRDLAYSHIDYLYKTGDEITDVKTQVSFEEAIVGLACLWNDVSYATIAKSQVGNLSDDITKAPYKALFNPRTNAFHLVNAVKIIREVEKVLQEKKRMCSGKEYGTCVHANRLIEHIILQKVREEKSFSETIINVDDMRDNIKKMVDRIAKAIVHELNNKYADSYPANVFKNQTKVKDICDKVTGGILDAC